MLLETFAEASTTSTTSTAIRNCDDVYYNNNNPSDGVYTIFTGFIFVEVYCEFPIGGPNWMVTLLDLFNLKRAN